MIKTYVYTLLIALASTLVALAIGGPAAFFCAKRKFFGKKILLFCSIVPLCVPALIVAIANISCFGVSGIFTKFLQFSGIKNQPTWLYSFFGIVLVQGFYNFPLITGILTNAWSSLPSQEADAARLLGADESRIFFTITLPQLSGAIGAACIPVFLFCFFSFMIVLLFSPPGFSVLEVEIYRNIRNSLDFKTGGILAVLETLSAIGVVCIYSLFAKKSQISGSGEDYTRKELYRIGKTPFTSFSMRLGEVIAFIVVVLLIFVFFICPVIAIILNGLTKKINGINHITFSLIGELFKNKNFINAFRNTVLISACSAFFCTMLGLIYSVTVKMNHKSGNTLLEVIPLIPMAVSSVVISWCSTMIFHKGSVPLLIFLEVLLYWPIGYRQIQNGINRIDEDRARAARIFSKNRLDEFFRFYIPATKAFALSSFGYCFAVCAGDATIPLVLSIPKFSNLALYTYRLSSSYRFNSGCAAALVLCALCGSVYLIFSSRKNSRP